MVSYCIDPAKDRQRADELLEQLRRQAMAGQAEAQYYLAQAERYQDANPMVAIPNSEPMELTRKASEQGFPEAQLAYSHFVAPGADGKIDASEMAKRVLKAAEQGLPEAEWVFAGYCFGGYGVERDPELGLKWYRKAAEQGYGWAQLELAERLASGRDVPKDLAEAAKWKRLAEEQGATYPVSTL